MASWLQNRIKVAEGLLEAVDRTAKEQADATLGRMERPGTRRDRARQGSPSNVLSPQGKNGAKSKLPNHAQSPKPPLRSRDASPEKQTANQPLALRLSPSTTATSISHPGPPDSPSQTSADPTAASPSLVEADAIDPPAQSANSGDEVSATQRPGSSPDKASASRHSPDRQQDSEQMTGSPDVERASHTPLGPGIDNSPSRTGSAALSLSASLSSSLNPAAADAVAKAIREAADRSDLPDDVDGQQDVSSTLAKEGRLTRMMESMKKKLDQLKSENAQLEDLLRQAEAASQGSARNLGRLEDELAQARAEGSSSRAELIASRETWLKEKSEMQTLLEGSQSQAAALQAQLADASLKSERMYQEREASETRMLTALRAEIAEVEHRLEEERFAAGSARQGFAAREHELEATLAESAAALSAQQRVAESRGQRLAAVEQRLAIADAENDRLQGQINQLESQHQRLGAGNPFADEQRGQEVAERVASLQAALSNSESQRLGLESEVATLRSSVDDLRKQHASTASTAEQDRRLREVTDLLYEKQSMLERLSAERSAQQMAWEQQLTSLQTDAERVKRRVKTERSNGPLEEGLVVCIEDLGGTYQRLANDKRVGKAVKASARFLDRTTLMAIRFLRQYPVGRLLVVAYIVFIHLFVYTLMHHLQQKAINTHPLRLDDG